jgi:hypothetical protein
MQGTRVIVGSIILISVGSMLLFISVPGRLSRDAVRRPATPSTRLAIEASCAYPDGGILIIENRLEALRVVKPKYPENAKWLHVEGPVEVTTLVDQNGDVTWACGKGDPALTSSAEEAAREFKFAKNFGAATPWISGRTPVVVNFDFRLNSRQGSSTEEFVWKYGGNLIGRLNVPAGFKIETYDYREGIVTTLRYNDGANITLQSGGMYQIPLFQGPGYDLISSKDMDAKTVRSGRFAKGDLYWREDNYKLRKITGKRISMLALFPPNLDYSQVPTARRSEFDRALDSFIREIDTNQAAGR